MADGSHRGRPSNNFYENAADLTGRSQAAALARILDDGVTPPHQSTAAHRFATSQPGSEMVSRRGASIRSTDEP
jgi:hypothetical protein